MHDRRRELKRVRLIAAASVVLGILKLLPGVDPLITAIEWVALKTLLPVCWELKDTLVNPQRSLQSLSSAPIRGNWAVLLHRAFPDGTGLAALGLDGVTDAFGLLPAPIDGFDFPALFADVGVLLMAQRALALLDIEQNQVFERSHVLTTGGR